MAFLANVSTQPEILWGSNFVGSVLLGYFIVLLLIYGSFNNILAMDECEFENDLQTSYFTFKRKIPFIFSGSKSKTVFSKKTFVLEVAGYFITLVILFLCVVSFFMNVDSAYALSILAFGIVIPYGLTTSVLRDRSLKKAKHKKKETWKKLNDDDY